MAAVGAPLLGDTLYGPSSMLNSSSEVQGPVRLAAATIRWNADALVYTVISGSVALILHKTLSR